MSPGLDPKEIHELMLRIANETAQIGTHLRELERAVREGCTVMRGAHMALGTLVERVQATAPQRSRLPWMWLHESETTRIRREEENSKAIALAESTMKLIEAYFGMFASSDIAASTRFR